MQIRQIARWCWRALLALVIILVVAGVAGWLYFRQSLAQCDGGRALTGLSANVLVERDSAGVPTINAANRIDAARATGFLHAQERFFQMDLLRRFAAGELSELIGPSLLSRDRELRSHRLRAVAQTVVRGMPVFQRAALEAYTAGVNSGLEALGARPPEYILLRAQPRPWAAEDSMLVGYAMFYDLQDASGEDERISEVLHQVLPPAALRFFAPEVTEWDAPIDEVGLPLPPMPSAAEFSFTNAPNRAATAEPDADPLARTPLPGSNNWAVDGQATASGAALISDDMHLGLRVPNTWYRLRLRVTKAGPNGKDLDIAGVSLPGTPAVVVGSNRHIAWAFTNGTLDNSDLVNLEVSPTDPKAYRTPEGFKKFEEHREIIQVKGASNEVLNVQSTIWGPVVTNRGSKQKRALCWVAHFPEAANLRLLELERVEDTATALRLAPSLGIPVQNFVVGDRAGRIGWTLAGRLPRRVGFDGRVPVSWADSSRGWVDWLKPDEYPRVEARPGGRIWTANNRVVGTDSYMAAGGWATGFGARARQIRDDLKQVQKATPPDMLRIQLDDRALWLTPWRELMLAALQQPQWGDRADIKEMRQFVTNWGGHASVDSVGYRLVRAFSNQGIRLCLEPLTQRCRALEPSFGYGFINVEQPALTILQKRPAHLLNPQFKTYDALMAQAVENILTDLHQQKLRLADATWGRRNHVTVNHPLSAAVPLLGYLLNMPARTLPGDSNMPRVQGAEFGASERLSVSPGHEEDGIFHMPGGQSGHFLSPFYRAGFDAWANGEPTPFLPGKTAYRLTLTP